jgi:hypothetical protein
MGVTPFFGMRGSGDWVTNEEPQNWRQEILELNPNGGTVLTGMISMIGQEETDSTHVNWWTRELSSQAGSVTSVYIDAALGTEYVYGSHQSTNGIAGAVVYAKVAAATTKMFRVGHKVILRDSDRPDADVIGKVVDVVVNGSSSYIAVYLLEDDDNADTASSYNLATVDRIMVSGNINPQGGTRPEAITYDPTQIYNVTGIWKTSTDLTRTAINVRLRTRDPQMDAKTQALLYHGLEMEKDLLFSIRYEGTGDNGKPEYAPMGLRQFIKTYASANEDNFQYTTDSDYTTKTWLQAGEAWLDEVVKTVFTYTPDDPGKMGGDRLAICGPGALHGINRLVKNAANYNISNAEAAYGIKVARWETVFGDIYLKVHPLFSHETTLNNTMVIVDPTNIIWRPLRNSDTFFKEDRIWRQGGGTGKDGPEDEWLTEGTWEFHHAKLFGWYEGVGLDNAN